MHRFKQRNNAGLTLIEVLIALAILSIALTAIIKCSGLNIKNLMYLENRTTATWVANDIINQARAGTLKLPQAPSQTGQDVEMLGQMWTWSAGVSSTPNKNIKKVDVEVKLKNSETRLAHLVGYLYVS